MTSAGHRFTRQLWWTCAAAVAAQLLTLPLAYILIAITVGLSGFVITSRPWGALVGVPVLVIGTGVVVLLEYLAALAGASVMRRYGKGLRDLPVRRVALGAVAGLFLGVIALQILDAWERELRDVGIADYVQFAWRAGLVLGGPLVGSAFGLRAWARSKQPVAPKA